MMDFLHTVADFLHNHGVNNSIIFTTIASAISSIVVFGIAALFNFLHKLKVKSDDRKTIRENGLQELLLLIKHLKEQGKEYRSYADSLKHNEQPGSILVRRANPYIEIWKAIPFPKYFDAYCNILKEGEERNLSIDALNDIYAHFKVIEDIEKENPLEEFADKYNEDFRKWDKNLNDINEAIYRMGEGNPNNERIKSMFKLLFKRSKIELYNCHKIVEDILTPLGNLFFEECNENPKSCGIEERISLSNLIGDCSFVKQGMEKSIDNYQGNFSRIANAYKKAEDRLTECMDTLKQVDQ